MKTWDAFVSIAQVSLIMVVTGGLLAWMNGYLFQALLGIGIGAFAAAATWVYRVLT